MASSNTVTKNLVRMKIDLAATGKQDTTAISLGTQPKGTVIARLEALDGTAIYKLEQAPRFDSATGAQPATGSTLWTTLVTYDTTVATSSLTQELTLAADSYYIRANVTTAHAASFGIVNLTFPK